MLSTLLLVPFLAIPSVLADDAEPAPPPSLACESSTFTPPDVPGVKVLSITAEVMRNYTTAFAGPLFPSTTVPDFCLVKVTLNHPGTTDEVLVDTWLPLTHDNWNGRFQATGGGGAATGMFDLMLAPAIQNGYAGSSTDGGHSWKDFFNFDWALIHQAEKNEYTTNWNLLHNFATRSLAEMVHVGKSITEQYFKEKPHHSYWKGCSQGGRQGYMMAQKYPGLIDGILAEAPAIGLHGLAMSDFWPQLLMIESGTLMSNCEFGWFLKQQIEKCDMLDGVRDGVITDPEVCDFDTSTLIGQKFECDGKEIEVTKTMADIVRKVQEGPTTPYGTSIWPGFPYGTDTKGTTNIEISPEGLRSPKPFGVSTAHISSLVLKDPKFNISTLTYDKYLALWAQSAAEYSWLLDSESPDLSGLREAGTKMLSWHGINDNLIPYRKTVQYREHVEMEMGGAKAVDEYYRFFLAPGVMHCGLGAGPVPNRPMEQLVDWVEKGEAPNTLDAQTKDAEGDLWTRDLCRWPRKLKYMGVGDPRRASSWSCEGEDEFEDLSGGADGNFLGGLKQRFMGLGLGLNIN